MEPDEVIDEVIETKDDVYLEGLKKVASEVTNIAKKTKEDNDQNRKDSSRAITDLGEKFEKGMLALNEKAERLAARTTVSRILGSSDLADDLLSVLSDDDKKYCKQVEVMPKAGLFEDLPDRDRNVHRAAAAAWLMHSVKAQSRQFGSNPATEVEAMNKIARAFQKDISSVAELTTGTASMGGDWIPDPVDRELRRLISDNSVVRQAGATVIPMETKTLDLPVEGSNAIAANIMAEATAITDSMSASQMVGKKTLTAKKFAGFAVVTSEQVMDSPVGILTWIQMKMTEQIARLEDTEALEGTSNFTGVAADSGANEITSGTNGSDLKFKDTGGNERGLVHVVFKAGPRASRRGARWFMAPEMLAAIVGLVDNNGQPIFKYGTVPGAIGRELLGFAFEEHDGVLAARTKGTGTGLTNIYFGPPSQIVFGDRAGMTFRVNDTVYFQSDALALRLIKRTGIVVAVPAAWTRWIDVNPV